MNAIDPTVSPASSMGTVSFPLEMDFATTAEAATGATSQIDATYRRSVLMQYRRLLLGQAKKKLRMERLL